MPSMTASRSGKVRLSDPEVAGLNTEERSPQTVRRHALILVSRMAFPVLRLSSFSRNCKTDVWSNTSEHTKPPRLHGDATTNGTLNPRPIELPRATAGVLLSRSRERLQN